MMYTMRTNYYPHELKLSLKYVCSCGHKMTRVNSDYYTMSPFNKHTEEACMANLNYSVFTQKRKCPKCGNTIQPFLSEDRKMQVDEWKRIYDEDCVRLNEEA
jgi:predicted RNA-binding Zn-ribbon protein involved in translation (DUF1610 family)